MSVADIKLNVRLHILNPSSARTFFSLKRLLSGKHRAFLAPTFRQPGKVIADANADPGALR